MSQQAALQHLQTDPILAQLIKSFDAPEWRHPDQIDLFKDVVESIISQQLSVRVADVITQRIYDLLPDRRMKPQFILDLDSESMRACGVSYAKIKYMKSAADAVLSGKVDFTSLPQKPDEDVIAELIKIHGVGRWTAEMLLIFSLQRPDIFSVGDLGLRTAVSKLYRVDRTDLPAIEAIAVQWSPYRSLASRYLWMSLDSSPKD